MSVRQASTILALTLTFLASSLTLPAFAQLGIGIGTWGGNFGTWIELWPWCCNRPRPARQSIPATQTNGYLEGSITVQPACPSNPSAASCPPDVMSSVVILAEPYGGTQSIISHPDVQGHYRLVLSPGSYNIAVHYPYLGGTASTVRQVVIQPGQTNRQDFQINPPIQ